MTSPNATDHVPPSADEARRRVWIAFADHFLDTETRQDLPWAALAAVEGGFTVEEARAIWLHEVVGVVGANLWSVAGEWAGWNQPWLLERLEALHRSHQGGPGRLWRLHCRLEALPSEPCWRAIRRCMERLQAEPPKARRAVAQDLVALGRHYFDFVPKPLPVEDPARRESLERLYRATFLPIFERLVVKSPRESKHACAARVEAALRGEPIRRGR
jgi:hypothetical protein